MTLGYERGFPVGVAAYDGCVDFPRAIAEAADRAAQAAALAAERSLSAARAEAAAAEAEARRHLELGSQLEARLEAMEAERERLVAELATSREETSAARAEGCLLYTSPSPRD